MSKNLLEIGLLVSLALASWQPTPALSAATDFDHCAIRGAKEMVTREAKRVKGGVLGRDFHDRVLKKVFETCAARHGINSYKDDRDFADVMVQSEMNEWKPEATRREEKLKAARLEAEEKKAMGDYTECVRSHEQILALASNEPAGTIIQATFASCAKERQEIFDVRKRHDAPYPDILVS
jgi:hypothetical protein